MKAVSAQTMRNLDRTTSENTPLSSEKLMRIAGARTGEALMEYIASLGAAGCRINEILVVAGKGNNAGDAFFAAKMLEKTGAYHISLFCAANEEELSPDAKIMFDELPPKIKGNLRRSLSAPDLAVPGLIVLDGLLGTGFKGDLSPLYAQWAGLINASNRPVVSIDIPSGMDADTGLPAPSGCVKADLTITMALPKKGMLTSSGVKYCGRIRVGDLFIPAGFVNEIADFTECCTIEDAAGVFGREEFDLYKNLRGHLLVVGGSESYPGAPFLAAEAALRSSAGLVTALVPAGCPNFFQLPKALMVRKAPDGGKGVFSSDSIPLLTALLEKADSVVIGPGLDRNEAAFPVLELVLNSGKRVLADADALNLMASRKELFSSRNCELVLTPHPGEAERLEHAFGLDSGKDRSDRARALAEKTASFVVLKGARSVVAAPNGGFSVNLSGAPSLATAGSGDVLSGICGALLARKELDVFDSLRSAVFLHGLCGELLSPRGSRGVIADDLVSAIPAAMRKVSPCA